MFLIVERHTSGRSSGLFFDLVLAGTVSAPHTTDKSRFVLNNITEFLIIVAVTAVSNVTGTVVDIETLIAWAKEYEIPVYIDAAQAVRHRIFDLQNCNAIFLVFPPIK